jgi:hypothetical protein
VLPLLGLIAIFAREREARIESVLTLRDAYRGTAHLLGEVLATTHEYTGSPAGALVGIVEAWDAPSRDEAGGQPDTDPSSEHKLEPAIG